MKAVVFYGARDLRLENVPEPQIEEPTDAIVRLTNSAICGTDLHLSRGGVDDLRPGTIPGHEGVGIIEALGKDVLNFTVGDRVIISPTIACGSCAYCRAGHFSQCNSANPRGASAAPAFFGGPLASGGFNGLLAEKARIPFAHTGLIKLPPEITDEQAVLLCDVAPTGYFAAELANVSSGDTVAIFGCDPAGLFAIACAKLRGAGRIFAIDKHPERLKTAQQQGAEIINSNDQNPVEILHRLTNGIGVDRAIDTVGISAENNQRCEEVIAQRDKAHANAQAFSSKSSGLIADKNTTPHEQALCWAVESLAKAGTLAIIGTLPAQATNFPLGAALNKSLTINTGNCPHPKYIPKLIELTLNRSIDPSTVVAQMKPLTDATTALSALGTQRCGWIKIDLLHGQQVTHNPTDPMAEEELDDAIEDSFPASDPPSMTAPKH